MVKLNGGRVLEHVSPPEIGLVSLLGKHGVHELASGGHESLAHKRERVVDHTSVEASNEGTGHGSEKDKAAEDSGVPLEGPQHGAVQLGELGNSRRGVGDPSRLTENLDTSREHGPVENESSSQVGSESVRGNSRVGVISLHELVVEARLDHPPANCTLETEKHGDDAESSSDIGRNSLLGNKVNGRENKGEADESTPESVGPLHPEDELEFRKSNVGVEKLELRRALVLVKLLNPVGLCHGRERSSHRLPLGDRETRLGESGKTTENNNSKDGNSRGNEPVASPLGRVDGPFSRSGGLALFGIRLSRLDHVDVRTVVEGGKGGELSGLVELGCRSPCEGSKDTSSGSGGDHLSTQGQRGQGRGLGGDLGCSILGLQNGEVAVEVEPRSCEEHCLFWRWVVLCGGERDKYLAIFSTMHSIWLDAGKLGLQTWDV